MHALVSSIVPIVLALVLGWIVGRYAPFVRRPVGALIGPLVWLLLFTIGKEFGSVLRSAEAIGHSVRLALIFAVMTTLLPWFAISLLPRLLPGLLARPPDAVSRRLTNDRFRVLIKPVKACVIALGCVAAGVAWHTEVSAVSADSAWYPSAAALLYFLIFCIGIDLSTMVWDPSWKSHHIWIVPLLVVVGSLAGGVIVSMVTGQPIFIALALSSGFGWFSLSGVLMAAHLGQAYGVIALLTDLFRELIAVLLLYALGTRFPHASIGASGATAMDTTLPIIKQNCPPDALPLALVSGMSLSVLAPLMMSFLLLCHEFVTAR